MLKFTVFLCKNNSVKLGDFGLSKVLEPGQDLTSTYVGTPGFMCPEMCEGMPYGRPSDIWALGCVIYELCAKRLPFEGRLHVHRIRFEGYREIPDVYSHELREVIFSCLQKKPKDRPNTAELLSKSYAN
jgi:serine/threonine protein kinase